MKVQHWLDDDENEGWSRNVTIDIAAGATFR
jgi:hypothetical protein